MESVEKREREVREAAGEIIRRGAELLLARLDEVSQQIHERHLVSPAMAEIAADPVLAAASLRAIRSTVAHWASAVATSPWAPVSAADDPDSLRMARDLVRRGLGDSITTAYRIGQAEAWRTWVGYATGASTDPAVIARVLDHVATSTSDLNEATLAVVREVVESERARLRRGDAPRRRETIELLLDGAPITLERASVHLGLDLSRTHTAAVIWTDAEDADQAAIEEVVDLVVRSAGATRHVATFPSTGTAWVWVAGPGPDLHALEHGLGAWPTIRVSVGEEAVEVDGFRASHRSAIATQRLLSHSGRRVARASDTRLVALLARHGEEARAYAHSVLGDLAEASPEMLTTVRTYLAEMGHITRTAERLFAHRNTVIRRLERADDLLPAPLASRPHDVAVALDLLSWLG